MKYNAPVLLEPEDGYAFIQGNTIVLRWEPVGELAPDEQYAVRMVYSFQNAPTYQGANIKESDVAIASRGQEIGDVITSEAVVPQGTMQQTQPVEV